jgi:hypothetical protein
MSELSEFVEEYTHPETPDGRRRPNRIDLTGRVFGYLTPLHFYGKDKFGRVRWICQCECGTQKVVRGSHLTSGAIQSCGCLRKGSTQSVPNQDAPEKIRRREKLAPERSRRLLAKLIEISSDEDLSHAMSEITKALFFKRKGESIGP